MAEGPDACPVLFPPLCDILPRYQLCPVSSVPHHGSVESGEDWAVLGKLEPGKVTNAKETYFL